MSKAIYTVIVDNYDYIKTSIFINSDFDYILFADEKTYNSQKKNIDNSNWEVVVLKDSDNPPMLAKDLKINPHKYLSGYETTIYVDGSFRQMDDIKGLLTYKNGGFLACKHPQYKCLYKQAFACVQQKKDRTNVINAQVKRYRNEGYPIDNGLLMGGILVRDNNERIAKINDLWWNEIQNGSIRDQISFNYVLWKLGESIDYCDYNRVAYILRHYPHFKKKQEQ
jgi:hypothetical protein